MKHLANGITASRILVALLLLACTVFSPAFYAGYLYCGISDMVDGTIARKTHSESELGARLDSVADLVFVLVCALSLLPAVEIPLWMGIWAGAIACLKLLSLILSAIRNRKILFLHTMANKITGGLVFLWGAHRCVDSPVFLRTGGLSGGKLCRDPGGIFPLHRQK